MPCSKIIILLSLIQLSASEEILSEIFVPKLIEPPRIVVRKLYKDPNNCHLMTWDSQWDKANPSVCRGTTCFRPYFDGETQPGKNKSNFMGLLLNDVTRLYKRTSKRKKKYCTRYSFDRRSNL